MCTWPYITEQLSRCSDIHVCIPALSTLTNLYKASTETAKNKYSLKELRITASSHDYCSRVTAFLAKFFTVGLRGYQLTAKNLLTRENIKITIKGKKYLTYLYFQNKLKWNDSSKCNQASLVSTLTNSKDLITIFYVNWTPESFVLSLLFSPYFVIPCGSIITSKKERFYLLYSRNQWDRNSISTATKNLWLRKRGKTVVHVTEAKYSSCIYIPYN